MACKLIVNQALGYGRRVSSKKLVNSRCSLIRIRYLQYRHFWSWRSSGNNGNDKNDANGKNEGESVSLVDPFFIHFRAAKKYGNLTKFLFFNVK